MYATDLNTGFWGSAGARLIGDTLAKTGEPWPEGFEMFKGMLDDKVKDPAIPEVMTPKPAATVSDLWVAQAKRLAYCKHILLDWVATRHETGTGREMDALLTPCTPWPAAPK